MKTDEATKPRHKLSFSYYWNKLRRLQGNPFVLARGVAIGAFIGFTPTIPFHTSLTILLCTIFKGNIVAAIIANWIVSNPFTIPVQYYLAWRVGTWITPVHITWKQVSSMLNQLEHAGFIEAAKMLFVKFAHIMYCLIAGGVILAIPVGMIFYFAALNFYLKRQKKIQEEFLKKNAQDDSSSVHDHTA
ncbi:MAG: hypothetical protein DSZ23_04705 [Thermodesulfatator sp.]|nr:MAG: hypothetical protein DSZ23_04705 [Thermodesulfatator sp.]